MSRNYLFGTMSLALGFGLSACGSEADLASERTQDAAHAASIQGGLEADPTCTEGCAPVSGYPAVKAERLSNVSDAHFLYKQELEDLIVETCLMAVAWTGMIVPAHEAGCQAHIDAQRTACTENSSSTCDFDGGCEEIIFKDKWITVKWTSTETNFTEGVYDCSYSQSSNKVSCSSWGYERPDGANSLEVTCKQGMEGGAGWARCSKDGPNCHDGQG